MLFAYAAGDGAVADDGQGARSPYTQALLAHLDEPGLENGKFFGKVRDKVLRATGGQQEPFLYGSLSSKDYYFKGSPRP